MNEPLLTVGVEEGADGRLRIISPRVGIWSEHPHPGALLGPGSRVGWLEHLNRRFALVLPDGASGRVRAEPLRDRAVAVEYGQVLLELRPVLGDDAHGLAQEERVSGHHALVDVEPGLHAVVAPTDGVFYRAGTPGGKPFVEVGVRIRAGQPLGLIEVMKTFSQIQYGGPGLPDEATVVEIRGADAGEVRAGQVLVVVR